MSRGIWTRFGRLVLGSVALSALLFIAAGPTQAQYNGSIKQKPYPYHDPLPILGKRVAARGIEFPKPWGVGINYMFLQQPVTISDIGLGVNDSGIADVSDFIKFKSVEAKAQLVNVRLDLWLFPFLNIYGMLNYAPQASTSIVLSEPFALNAGAEQWIVGEGFGMTGAFGAFGAWGTLDANFTWNQTQLIEGPVQTFLLTPRAGMAVGKWGKVGLNLWLGAMAQFIGSETSGSIRLSDALDGSGGAFKDKLNAWYDGLPPAQQRLVEDLVDRVNEASPGDTTVQYKLDKKVAQRWNMLVGAQLEINTSWFVRVEVGFIKRESCLIGLNYRFGTPSVAPRI